MTLAQIMKLALCQLDEDPADIEDYKERFMMYANDGYHILLSEYYKPVTTLTVTTDENGYAPVEGMGILRVVSAKDEDGREVAVRLTPDGAALETGRPDTQLALTCEVERPLLERIEDEPELPEHAHSALVDYICFRYLSTGNLAKQSRAQAFQNSFYTAARRLKPQGRGSVTRMKNLYAMTDIRGGW
ncbi:MAG: hypothetical protein SO155_11135 [Candidatus Ventricola sp.]|nr:hypothetical protein [Candidatus Ventricola sp.]